MSPRSLGQWLSRLERLHPYEIELGLERVAEVAARLRLTPGAAPILTIGGTNGKGSCVAFSEAMLLDAGYRVGAYTSPHLLHYNERVRIAGREATDDALVEAFERVEAVRGSVSLTYFEFGTLAAALMFRDAGCDAWVLEVGLGGRLDAVNLFDATVAVITSVGLDHQQWLGPDVESIGREKAGILRSGRPAVFGDRIVPDSVIAHARALDARLLRYGHEFGSRHNAEHWTWWGVDRELAGLPLPAMHGEAVLRNACCALTAVAAAGLSLERSGVERALRAVRLPGRFQILPGDPEWILDVAHNPQAALELAANLAARPCRGRTLAVFGMLADKDVAGVTAALSAHVDVWLVVGLEGSRGLDAAGVAERVTARPGAPVQICSSIGDACERAEASAVAGDRVLACGSFRLVGPVLERLYLPARILRE